MHTFVGFLPNVGRQFAVAFVYNLPFKMLGTSIRQKFVPAYLTDQGLVSSNQVHLSQGFSLTVAAAGGCGAGSSKDQEQADT